MTDLPQAIRDIPPDQPPSLAAVSKNALYRAGYRDGHRDAREAAARLAERHAGHTAPGTTATDEQLAEGVRDLKPTVPDNADECYGRAMYRDGFEAAVGEVLALLAAAGAGAEVTYEVCGPIGDGSGDWARFLDQEPFESISLATTICDSLVRRGRQARVFEVVRRAVGRGEGSNQP